VYFVVAPVDIISGCDHLIDFPDYSECCGLHNIAMNEDLPLPEPAQADNMS